MVLPHILEYSKDAVTEQLADLSVALGLGTSIQPRAELAQSFIDAVWKLNRNLNIPGKMEALKACDISNIAKRAYDEAIDMHAGPKYMGKRDIEGLLQKLI